MSFACFTYRPPAVRRGGFTLIEVLIVVAIIGILAAIAIPRYTGFLVRSANGACLQEASSVVRLIVAERIGQDSTAPDITWRACTGTPTPALSGIFNGAGVTKFSIEAATPGTGTITCDLDSATCRVKDG